MAKKLDINLKIVHELARRGFSVSLIADSIGVARSTVYKQRAIRDTIKKGRAEIQKKVIDDLLERSEADVSATASIFLAKQLKVFDIYFPTSKPKSISQALNKIADVYTAYAGNELDGEKADRLIKYLEIYIKGYEATELERRLTALEENA